MPTSYFLKNLTRESLEAVWSHPDISATKIAETLGVTRQGIAYKAASLGLPPKPEYKGPEPKVSDKVFSEMWNLGLSSADIAKLVGYKNPRTVLNRRAKLGLEPRISRRSRITIDQYREIKMVEAMKNAGELI